MAEHLYSAFGMRIRSELSLALPSAANVKTPGSDPTVLTFQTPAAWMVDIVTGPVPEYPDLPNTLGKIRYGRAGDAIIFDVPWAARYSIEGGSRIVVERVAGAREDFTGLYISGLILATMLGARGSLALHGSAVVGSAKQGSTGNTGRTGCLVFIGDKGAGKSTTAAALTAHGYRILCDDVIPIASDHDTHHSLVLPGIPLPKLLPDAYEKLIGDPQEAPHLFDGVNKYQVSLPSSDEPAPLRMIFALEISERAELRIEPIKGAAKIQRVLQNAMSLQGLDDPTSIFTRCAERLASVPCYRVLRPAGKNCLDELADAIVALDRKAETSTVAKPVTGEAH